MHNFISLIAISLVFAIPSTVIAGEEPGGDAEETIVISIKTDDFEVEETDLSHLSIGDAETFVTDSGKTVDMLRTEDGIEIYVDGELLDTGPSHGEQHSVHKVKIVCDEDKTDCEELVWISEGGEIDMAGDHKVIIVESEVTTGEWTADVLSESAHEVHADVHIVREHDGVEPGDIDAEHERKVIIIKSKTEDEI